MEASEKMKSDVEKVRQGVRVKPECDAGEMMGGTWTWTQWELLSMSYSDIAVSTDVVVTMTVRE
jgi:hypothetical protein